MSTQDCFEALADPTRRKILEILKHKELSVNEIAKYFSISGASLSHHLNKLKAADLVLRRREGQQIFYSLHTSVFEDVAKSVYEFFNVGGRKRVLHPSKSH